MVTTPVTAYAAMPSISVPPLATPEHETAFRDVLSALNPLQYLPGVGTIYRVITGDSPPEFVRVIGSIVVGGLLGGPIGAAISAVSSFAQHMVGIDLDRVAHDIMIDMGLMSDTPPQSTIATLSTPVPITPSTAHSATAAEAPVSQWAELEPDLAAPSTVQLRTALAAYNQTMAPYAQRLGHV